MGVKHLQPLLQQLASRSLWLTVCVDDYDAFARKQYAWVRFTKVSDVRKMRRLRYVWHVAVEKLCE